MNVPVSTERILQRRRQSLRLAIAWGAVFAVAAIGMSQYDLQLENAFDLSRLPGDVRRLVQLSELFAHGSGFVIIILGIWSLAPDLRRFLPRMITAYLLTGVLGNLIKLVIWRYRPSAILTGAQAEAEAFAGTIWQTHNNASVFNVEYITQSFPSCHSAAVAALAISLCILLPRGRYLFFGMAGLACLQRIFFNAHWPSDVMAGIALGIWVTAFAYFAPVTDAFFARFERMPSANSSRREEPGMSLLR